MNAARARNAELHADRPGALSALRIGALATVCVLGCSSGGEAARKSAPPDPAQVLYAQGKYAEALPLLEKAAAERRTGSLLYQIGYCKGVAEGTEGASKKKLWSEARPLLEQEIAAPGQATLDRLYYLTVISSDDGQAEATRKYGRQAVDTIEKGEAQSHLSGEEWFRLARIHEFLEEPSEAEAAYRRSVSAFRTAPAVNPTYQALALARVGDLDLDNRHYEAAADEFAEALKLVPGLNQIQPYRNGIALFGAGRFDDAIAAFGSDRDPRTMTESQYASDLARRTKEAGGVIPSEPDGVPIDKMPLESLEGRIKEATTALRAAREKNSYKPGDPLAPEIADRQRRFASLLRERFLQTGELQEFCLQEGLADLVRR
jgi:tetratricopeptide (TPR) repeat protein